MTVRILKGDCREVLHTLPEESVHCVVTSPPYWGLRDYGVAGQLGMESTLGEHIAVMVDVFNEVRRVMRKDATLWLNYGDCYATKPNGRSAAATKAAGNDDRTFRDKPFDTTGAIYRPEYEKTMRGGQSENFGNVSSQHGGRVCGYGPILKPKDLCMIPNRLAIALQENGWWVRSEIVWGKNNPMPDSSGKYRPSTAHEKIWLLTKSGKSSYDSEAVALPCSEKTNERVSQKKPDNWDTAPGAHGSHHRNGREKGATIPKQDGHSRRHAGFNERYFGVGPKSAPENSSIRASWKGSKFDGPRDLAVRPDTGRKRAEVGSGIKNNDSMDAALSVMPETRYLRNYEPAPLMVWEMSTQPFSEAHFATFPPELAERCIKAGCPIGGTVLDPFGGAGTTGLVADRLGRDAILIELNHDYATMAERRIKNDAPMFAEVSAA